MTSLINKINLVKILFIYLVMLKKEREVKKKAFW